MMKIEKEQFVDGVPVDLVLRNDVRDYYRLLRDQGSEGQDVEDFDQLRSVLMSCRQKLVTQMMENIPKPDCKNLSDYLRLESAGSYPLIGEGAFNQVSLVDGDKVLKIAKKSQLEHSNKDERDYAIQRFWSSVYGAGFMAAAGYDTAEVFAYDPQNFAMLSEYIVPDEVTPDDRRYFEQLIEKWDADIDLQRRWSLLAEKVGADPIFDCTKLNFIKSKKTGKPVLIDF